MARHHRSVSANSEPAVSPRSASSADASGSAVQQPGGRLRAAAQKLKHKFTHAKEEDQSPLATVPEARQLSHTDSLMESRPATPSPHSPHVNFANTEFEWLGGRDICVQVLQASSLRAADIGGTSDPLCKVFLGSQQACTRALKKVLNPDWNETFVFALSPQEVASMRGPPRVTFEVWNFNELAVNDFLGEAQLEITPAIQEGKFTQQLALRDNSARHRAKTKQISGQVEVAVWLGFTDNILGRMHAAGPDAERQRTTLSTLVRPFGQSKTMPLVVHSSGNTVYEEPCMAYIHFNISKVRGLVTDFMGLTSMGRQSSTQTSGLTRSSSQQSLPSPAGRQHSSRLGSLLHRRHSPREAGGLGQDPPKRHGRRHRRHQSMSDFEEVQETLRPDQSSTPEGGSPRDHLPEQPSPFRQWFSGGEPGWGEEDPLNRPTVLDKAGSERGESEPDHDTDAGSSTLDGPFSSKKRYYYVTMVMGSQKHITKLIHPEDDGALSWESACTFVVQLPIRDRIIRLQVHSTSSRTKEGKLLAHAHIPLFQLIGFSQDSQEGSSGQKKAEQGQWFRLHSQSSKVGQDAGIVRLATALLDGDIRRTMYKHPLLSQEKYQGRLKPYEQQAWQQGDTAQPVNLLSEQLPDDEVSRSAQEGVMSWLHDEDPPQTPHLDQGDLEPTPSAGSGPLSAGSQLGSRPGSHLADWPGPPTPPYVPQQPQPPQQRWLEAATDHAKAAAESGKQAFLEALQQFKDSQQASASAAGPKPRPGVNVPAGMLKITLHAFDLVSPALCYGVIKAGPHWGRTTTIAAATKATWNWEVHVPLYDPSTMLLLAVCVAKPKVHKARIVTRAVRSMLNEEDSVLGKLRIRLSTLKPWEEVSTQLPMLSDRDKGGTKVGQAHISLKVLSWNQRILLTQYIKPHYPDGMYRFNLQSGDLAKKVAREHERAVAAWLGSVNPPISSAVATGVIDTQRWKFTMARAKTNWRRLQNVRATLGKYGARYDRLQSWEQPQHSLAAIACTTLLAFYPHVMLSIFFLYLMFHSLLRYRGEHQGEPLEMEAEAAEAEDLSEEHPELLAGNTSAVANLRRKYAQLLAVALTLQNLLDDIATQLERLHSCVTWQDPSATLLFIAFCAAAAMGLALLGLPTIFAFGCFWMLRPPKLRTPTPPPPVSFFKRLPSVTDQLI